MDKKILSTLGPASLNIDTIHKLDKAGVDIFRINLSHTNIEDLQSIIDLVAKSTNKPLCLDTEGAQIRNGMMKNDGVFLNEGNIVTLHKYLDIGDEENILLRPENVIEQLKIGDLVSIDFDTVLLKIINVSGSQAQAKVLCSGKCGSNKAVTVDRFIKLDPLSDKDIKAIQIGLKNNLKYAALSFANCEDDVKYIKELSKNTMHIISKIETRRGVSNIESILNTTDSILIDRGDLSREEPLEMIPLLQKRIINVANSVGKPAYVATNLLESMINQKKPTRAEVNDVVNTLIDGASGLVLAAETAIGKYPVDCVNMIFRLIGVFKNFNNSTDLSDINSLIKSNISLIEPHGGKLVNCINLDYDSSKLNKLKSVKISKDTLVDIEQIATGVYSPIDSFMNKDEINSVLDNNKLLSGHVWTLPIVLQLKDDDIYENQELALEYQGEIVATMMLESLFTLNLDDYNKKLYGTNDINHPGVKKTNSNGNQFVSGKITLVKFLDNDFRQYTLTPFESRLIFEHKGWNKIIGFHTRNIPHKSHEFIQKNSLSQYNADGVFINPVVGSKKDGDFQADVIFDAYNILIKNKHLENKNLLAGFNTYSRYAGPREAVFTAICRKNFGCSHFIVGRDHTGVGSFYTSNESADYFDTIEDIGIEIIKYGEVVYNDGAYCEVSDSIKKTAKSISATQIRKCLIDNEQVPSYMLDENISTMLLDEIKNGNIFVAESECKK
ncbi:pyruvate kinase [Arcobacter sp.]|uniref:pyruvate kinase n=1 Tax=Arcobacter sp. TaxID=1872629 RepID=UPI003D0E54EB